MALRWSLPYLLIVVLLYALSYGVGRQIDPLEEAEHRLYAQRLRWTAGRGTDPRVVIVGLDDRAFQEGKVNRKNHVKFLRNLHAAGAEVVFLDLIFDEPREPASVDQQLAEELERTDFAVLARVAARYELETPDGERIPQLVPEPLIENFDLGLADARIRTGLINTSQESGLVLSGWVAAELADFEADPDLELGEQPPMRLWPSASLAILARLNHLLPSDLKAEGDSIAAPPDHFPCTVTNETKELYVEGQPRRLELGRFYKVLARFQPPVTGPRGRASRNGFLLMRYPDLLDPKSPALKKLDGAIVLVGENTTGPDDLYETPVGPMKGIEIHANVLSSLLTHSYLRPVPVWWAEAHSLALVLSIALVVALTWRLSLAAFLGLGIMAVDFGLNVAFFWNSWYFPAAAPLAAAVSTLILCLAFRYLHALGVLERYLPREAIDELIRTGHAGAREELATVLVTDIRGYTTLSEGKTPLEILKMLNQYHDLTVTVYENFGGRALAYQGDAQIVVFSHRGRSRRGDPCSRAIQAAREMQETIDWLREHWGIRDRSLFDVGAALATGRVTIGEVGAAGRHGRSEYTVIGDTVRMAHKMQSMSQVLESPILLDEITYGMAEQKPPVREFPDQLLEGFTHTTNLYGVRSEPDPD